MVELNCHVQDSPRGVVVSLRGEAHNDRADLVRETLGQLRADGSGPVVIDMEGLGFMASRTIAELLACRERLQSSGRPMRLAGANHDVQRLLAASRLSELFPVYATTEDALAAEA